MYLRWLLFLFIHFSLWSLVVYLRWLLWWESPSSSLLFSALLLWCNWPQVESFINNSSSAEHGNGNRFVWNFPEFGLSSIFPRPSVGMLQSQKTWSWRRTTGHNPIDYPIWSFFQLSIFFSFLFFFLSTFLSCSREWYFLSVKKQLQKKRRRGALLSHQRKTGLTRSRKRRMCRDLPTQVLLSTLRPKLSFLHHLKLWPTPLAHLMLMSMFLSPPTQVKSCQEGSSLLRPSLCRPQTSHRPTPPTPPPHAHPHLTAPQTQSAPLQSPPSPSPSPPQWQCAQLLLPPQDSPPPTAKPHQGFPPLSPPPHLPPHLHFPLKQHLRWQWPRFICRFNLSSCSMSVVRIQYFPPLYLITP